jgi:hypothetical protein
MYESESSTFEAKFKPSVAIVWIENTLPYPGNERSAAPIEKDVGSANQSIHAVVRIGVKEATSSRKSGEVVGGISKISCLLVARVQSPAQGGQMSEQDAATFRAIEMIRAD